jgi:hypothetical protein
MKLEDEDLNVDQISTTIARMVERLMVMVVPKNPYDLQNRRRIVQPV